MPTVNANNSAFNTPLDDAGSVIASPSQRAAAVTAVLLLLQMTFFGARGK